MAAGDECRRVAEAGRGGTSTFHGGRSDARGGSAVNSPTILQDAEYKHALAAVERTLEKLKGCSPEEKGRLQEDFHQLQDLLKKLTSGKVEIVVFGEISTGKSALINALIGEAVASV